MEGGVEYKLYEFNAVKELKMKPRTVLSSYLPSKAAAVVWQKGKTVAMSLNSNSQ